ncbi:MAG: TolC family protein [Alphaproteobacteria bacterium]|nr:TolC family protein [Alphaproteobacteria bacterium]MBO4643913.1 TolC family protein [Alphaproteobacteria bacterium]
MKKEFLIKKNFWKRTSFLTTSVAALLIAACSVEPEPLSDWERAVRVDQDIQEMFQDQRSNKIMKPISLYDAMARALKYNLNSRLKLMETALSAKQFDLSSVDMLPQVSAQAGYSARSNYEAVVSKSMQNGVMSQDARAYSSKSHGIANAQISWNILDFGVSYYQAKQDANRILMVKEQRRKQVQALLQDVRAAYWRALAAERLAPEIDDLMEEATFVLENLRAMGNESKENSPVLLNYQMGLMETMRDLSEMKKELLLSRESLAALMNLKPGTRYRLVGSENGNFVLPEIRSNLDRLEWLALMNRPELREEDYKLQNTRLAAKKALLKLLPGINLSASANYDSDDFLSHNSWLQAAAQLGWNLLNPARMQKTLAYGEVKEAVDNLNRQVTAMTVLTQTHIGWGRYQGAKETYQLSVEIAEVAQKLAQQASENAKTDVLAEAEKVSTAARALFAKLRSAMNWAELQDATGYVFVTLGLDPLPADFASNDLGTISRALERVMTAWDMGRFTNEDYPRLPPVPMHRPPVYINANLPMQRVLEDSRFVVTVPPTTFAEADLGHKVAYTATMRDGSPLLPWLFFDSKTITLSGRPPATSEGIYEIKIMARNSRKMSAYIFITVQAVRGYKTILDMRGAEPDSRVTVIQRCDGSDECRDYQNVRQIEMFPEKVTVTPLPLPTKNRKR